MSVKNVVPPTTLCLVNEGQQSTCGTGCGESGCIIYYFAVTFIFPFPLSQVCKQYDTLSCPLLKFNALYLIKADTGGN